MDENLCAGDPRPNTNLSLNLTCVVLVIALALLAAHPFLARPSLPRATDAELHVFRAAELGHALRGGAGYVRWAPDLWYGYGYPIFNYYAPLTYYLANAFALLPGLDIVAGVKALFILGLLLAAVGAFLLGRDLFGLRAGLVAAAAYTFSPYILFVNPHMRGDLPECFALALFPWMMRAGVRAFRPQLSGLRFRAPSLTPLIAAYAVLWAALILTHNLMALILSVIFVAWQAYQIANRKLQIANCKSQFVSLVMLVALAAGLSAFFWLPFVAERGAVHLTVIGEGHFDFHNHFVAWRSLLAPSRPLDLGATAPKFQYNLGLAQWLLALPAIPLAGLYRRRPQGRALAFFAACSAWLVFLMLSPSAFVWEHVPLMPYIQFPWRLLGPAALTLAMCAAGTIWGAETALARLLALARLTARSRFISSRAVPDRREWGACRGRSYIIPRSPRPKGRGSLPRDVLRLHSLRSRRSLKACLAPLAACFLLFSALPAMYPPPWSPDFGSTTPRGILQVELEGHYLGTTSTGDFVPATVVVHPPSNPGLIASYEQGLVDKFDRSTLPAGAEARVVEHGPRRDRFAISSPQAFTARVLTFHFPGWEARVDGERVPIHPSGPYGFIEVDLPAGSHELLLSFGTTPPRIIGALVSLMALVAVALQVSRFRFHVSRFDFKSQVSNLKFEILVIAAFALFKFAVADPCDTCFRYTSQPGQALSAQHQFDEPVNFGHQVQLLGYDLPVSQVRAGDKLALTLYWKAAAPIPNNYQAFVHLVGPATSLWGQSDKLNPGDFPTTRWPLDKFVWDDHQLRVLPNAPPGEYQLSVGLYTLGDGQRVLAWDGTGQALGDSFALPASVRVLPP
jgi:hypothetical protein